MRWVFVNEPFFSITEAAGSRKISVGTVLGSTPSGSAYQKLALSISKKSRTTSHSRRQSIAMQSSIGSSHRWILSHQERSADVAFVHLEEVTHLGKVFVDLGKPFVTVVVLSRGGFAIPRLEQADGELRHVVPDTPDDIFFPQPVGNIAAPAQIALTIGQVLRQGGVAGHRPRLRQVAGQ